MALSLTRISAGSGNNSCTSQKEDHQHSIKPFPAFERAIDYYLVWICQKHQARFGHMPIENTARANTNTPALKGLTPLSSNTILHFSTHKVKATLQLLDQFGMECLIYCMEGCMHKGGLLKINSFSYFLRPPRVPVTHQCVRQEQKKDFLHSCSCSVLKNSSKRRHTEGPDTAVNIYESDPSIKS